MSNISMTQSKPQEATSERSELDKLKIENHKLKSAIFNLSQQLNNANARLTGLQLKAERDSLELEYGSEIMK
jgi:predicted  nucleic acid-binding Zn-ribbon protein